MCQHNEEDYDCLDCCYFRGIDDFLDSIYDPPYKNWDQCNAYCDGQEYALENMDV